MICANPMSVLLQSVENACNAIHSDECQGWIGHAKRFFFWSDQNQRQNVECSIQLHSGVSFLSTAEDFKEKKSYFLYLCSLH